jgi:putative membrane protein
MKRASEFFTESERAAIESAILETEGKTSAEVVVAVGTASGRYDRAEDIVGLWLAMITLVVTYFVLPFPEEVPDWGWSLLHGRILVLVVAAVVAFFVGAMVASRWLALRRLFTPAVQMRDEASLRARQVFYDSRVHHTTGATGLLIFLSLYERQTVVLADQAVLAKIPQAMVDELCRTITEGLRDGRGAASVCEAVREAGNALAPVLPRAEGDVDELANRVVILD